MNGFGKGSTTPAQTTKPAFTDESLADPPARVAGAVVGSVLCYVVLGVLAVLIAVFRPIRPGLSPTEQWLAERATVAFAFGVPAAVVVIVPVAIGRQTAGQRGAGIRTVLYPSGAPVGFRRAAAHLTLALVTGPLTLLLAIHVLWRDPRLARKRLWYDRALGTAVVWQLRWRRQMEHCCQECGYNLTGLPEPRCPECGTPFERFES